MSSYEILSFLSIYPPAAAKKCISVGGAVSSYLQSLILRFWLGFGFQNSKPKTNQIFWFDSFFLIQIDLKNFGFNEFFLPLFILTIEYNILLIQLCSHWLQVLRNYRSDDQNLLSLLMEERWSYSFFRLEIGYHPNIFGRF